MRQVNSLSHTKWECKYHIVFIPKYRRKALFGQIRRELPAIFHHNGVRSHRYTSRKLGQTWTFVCGSSGFFWPL